MNRLDRFMGREHLTVPHRRGDEPTVRELSDVLGARSPQTWG